MAQEDLSPPRADQSGLSQWRSEFCPRPFRDARDQPRDSPRGFVGRSCGLPTACAGGPDGVRGSVGGVRGAMVVCAGPWWFARLARQAKLRLVQVTRAGIRSLGPPRDDARLRGGAWMVPETGSWAWWAPGNQVPVWYQTPRVAWRKSRSGLQGRAREAVRVRRCRPRAWKKAIRPLQVGREGKEVSIQPWAGRGLWSRISRSPGERPRVP